MSEFDLTNVLSNIREGTATELASTPTVVDVGDTLDLEKLAVTARQWNSIEDVVAVCADLKNSTKLGTNKWAASTASIYQAATGGVVEVFNQVGADFIDIQGDGAFALFCGDRRYERALAAGITVKTFSAELVDALEAKWDDLPETGFKVGIASSRLLVKKVGTPRNPAQQEPVWAGKAVNYAAKCAQGADRHELVVTGTVWNEIQGNDYLAFSCPCGSGPSTRLWEDVTIERLPDGDPDAHGRLLRSVWCSVHGEEFCAAVLSGDRRRDDVTSLRSAANSAFMKDALRNKLRREIGASAARRRGLAA